MCAPKDGMLTKAQSNESHLNFIFDVKQSFLGGAAEADSNEDPLLLLLSSRLESPVEVIFFHAKGSKIPIPIVHFYGLMNVDTAEQLSGLLNEISLKHPEFKVVSQITSQCEAALMIKGFPAFLRYSVSTREFNLLVGLGATKELLDHTIQRLKPSKNHPMHRLDDDIDTGRQGFLVWVNFQNILSLPQPYAQLKDMEELKKWGLTDLRSITLSWGTAQGKGMLKLIVDGPKTGYRRFLPEFINAHDLTARGIIRSVMAMNLPLYELFHFIKTVAIAQDSTYELDQLLEIEYKFIKELGIPIEDVFSAMGPEIVYFSDEAGKFLAIRINDIKRRDYVLRALIEKYKLQHKTYFKIGKTYLHLLMPENLLFDITKYPKLKSARLDRIKGHFYWIEDEGYMIFAGIPQALFDRCKHEKRVSIYKWLMKNHKQDLRNAVCSYSTTIPDRPRQIYYLYLQLLSMLSDMTGVELNLFEMPSAHEIDLPHRGTYGIKLDVSEERVELAFVFENNPLEFLLSGNVLPVVGVAAAIAVPNFLAYREKAHESEVKITLRNLATSEEAYYAEHNTYTSDFNELGIKVSHRVKVKMINADDHCFMASATKEDIKSVWTIDCNRDLRKVLKSR